MIAKNILGYKLGTTKDELTSHAGLALFGEFTRGLGVLDLLNKRMPKPDNKKGFKPSLYVYPLVLMLHDRSRSRQCCCETYKRDTGRAVAEVYER